MAKEEEGDAIPSSVRRILDSRGLFIPAGMDESQQELFQAAAEGQCMTCLSPLGRDTALVVIAQGVVGVYCHVRCLRDMQIVGFLREELNDLSERVAFRGEVAADEPEENQDG